MLRWALWIVGGAIAIVAVVAIIGAMLPKGHVATRAAKYRETPDVIWQALTIFKIIQSGGRDCRAWNSFQRRLDILCGWNEPGQDGTPKKFRIKL